MNLLRIRNEAAWSTLLLRCGVRVAAVGKWATIFSTEMVGPVFSSGEDELDDFLVQILHESDMLQSLEEDLFYSTPGRLMQIWPSRFKTIESELPFLRNPEALANKVYGGRMGNVGPGDGWRNRGSGLIQITGADNLRAVQKQTGVPVYDNPELLRKPSREALRVVIAWWEGRISDEIMGDVVKITKKVQGGAGGLKERTALQEVVLRAIRGVRS